MFGAVAFAVSPQSRAGSDKRSTLSDLYSGRADYKSKVNSAVESLVAEGYILPLDAEYLYRANAKKISEYLIPLP